MDKSLKEHAYYMQYLDGLMAEEWQRRPSDLLKALNSIVTKKRDDPKEKVGWPKAPNKLKEAIQRVAPNLRAMAYTLSVGGQMVLV